VAGNKDPETADERAARRRAGAPGRRGTGTRGARSALGRGRAAEPRTGAWSV